jgi:hypothetical protein
MLDKNYQSASMFPSTTLKRLIKKQEIFLVSLNDSIILPYEHINLLSKIGNIWVIDRDRYYLNSFYLFIGNNGLFDPNKIINEFKSMYEHHLPIQENLLSKIYQNNQLNLNL